MQLVKFFKKDDIGIGVAGSLEDGVPGEFKEIKVLVEDVGGGDLGGFREGGVGSGCTLTRLNPREDYRHSIMKVLQHPSSL